jgi:serine/threonine-protein kinase PknG
VEVPPVPYKDPSSVILADPHVAERKRFCAACDAEVGRGRDGHPGREEGFCPHCGHRFSFAPKLHAGDLVAGQYEVVGCIAHGGLGWIYLAKDKNVSDRWVVLKGLLDSGDADAMEAAIAERRFLARVEHPNIVKIYNFVQHDGCGYIVMEYVGGQSLKEIRAARRDQSGEALPLSQAIALMLEILPALGYLHSQGLLYCDFKPDNVVQTEEQIKLIDLGGVRAVDDNDSALYGTTGYQAPEVSEVGASVSSDLYTVARTLAVLSFDFRGFSDESRYATSLPPVDGVPLFGRYPSFHRFLVRATEADPDLRFTSAEEMADQLLGVLREVVAIDGGDPGPAASKLFTRETVPDPAWADWRRLPVPLVDPHDPGAPELASMAAAGAEQVLAAFPADRASREVRYRLAQAQIGLGRFAEAAELLAAASAEDPYDWRTEWWSGMAALAQGRFGEARERFDNVYAELPGEVAPKLAAAHAAEGDRAFEDAAGYYELVAALDPASASASFGLARCRTVLGDRDGAAGALRSVPETSSSYGDAQVALCRVLAATVGGTEPDTKHLVAATSTVESLTSDTAVHIGLTRLLLEAALRGLEAGHLPAEPSVTVAGSRFVERDVRFGLERACRAMAKLAASRAEAVTLIDTANSYRPRTLL